MNTRTQENLNLNNFKDDSQNVQKHLEVSGQSSQASEENVNRRGLLKLSKSSVPNSMQIQNRNHKINMTWKPINLKCYLEKSHNLLTQQSDESIQQSTNLDSKTTGSIVQQHSLKARTMRIVENNRGSRSGLPVIFQTPKSFDTHTTKKAMRKNQDSTLYIEENLDIMPLDKQKGFMTKQNTNLTSPLNISPDIQELSQAHRASFVRHKSPYAQQFKTSHRNRLRIAKVNADSTERYDN